MKIFQINNRLYYSTSTKPFLDNNINVDLDPYFITGITDAEGCFSGIIIKSSNTSIGWRVEVVFQIGLHRKDLLKTIKAYFGTGIISENKLMCAFRVSSPEQIVKYVLPHFDKYPLITDKFSNYLIFKRIVEMILNKQHLNVKGLQEIVNLRAYLNLGLTGVLKEAFPNTCPKLN